MVAETLKGEKSTARRRKKQGFFGFGAELMIQMEGYDANGYKEGKVKR